MRLLDLGRKRPFDAKLERVVNGLIEGRLTTADAIARRVVEISTAAAVPTTLPMKKPEDEEAPARGVV